jgi:TonB family protein
MRPLFFILLLLPTLACLAQDTTTTWFNSKWEPTEKANATYYGQSWKDAEGLFQQRDYFADGRPQMSGSFLQPSQTIKTGRFVYYYTNGQTSSEGNYANNLREGMWQEWHSNGQLKSKGNYVKGEREGSWVFWFDNGQKSSEGQYRKNLMEGSVLSWQSNATLNEKGTYSNGKKEGLWQSWYENGNKSYEAVFNQDRLHGMGKWYFLNGRQSSEETYELDEIVKATYWDDQGKQLEKPLEDDRMPSYPGDSTAGVQKYLQNNLHYPAPAKEQNIQGRVIVRFAVDYDGTIKEATVTEPVNELLDAEAARVIMAMPKWKHGIQHNRPVKVYFSLPISFKLQ